MTTGSTTRFAEHAAGRVAYVCEGEGEPAVVLVHGASSNRTIWQPVMEVLRDSFTVVALDRLGYGDSDAPDIAYDMTVFAESVLAVMDAEQLESAVLVGHSNGVPVVRQVCRLAPTRVAGAVLLDGGLRAGIAPAMQQWMREQLAAPDYRGMLADLVKRMPTGELPPDQAESLRSAALAVPQHVMLGELDAMTDDEIFTADAMAAPLLVVRTGAPSAHEGEEAYVRSLNPRATYEAWESSTHMLVLTEAARVAQRIGQFVDAIHHVR